MRIIIIDPKERTITEQEIERDWRIYREIVGGTFELVRFSDTDCYINENGHFLKEKPTFTYVDPRHGPTMPLIGRAFLCWHRGDNEAPCKLSLDTVRERVIWPN